MDYKIFSNTSEFNTQKKDEKIKNTAFKISFPILDLKINVEYLDSSDFKSLIRDEMAYSDICKLNVNNKKNSNFPKFEEEMLPYIKRPRCFSEGWIINSSSEFQISKFSQAVIKENFFELKGLYVDKGKVKKFDLERKMNASLNLQSIKRKETMKNLNIKNNTVSDIFEKFKLLEKEVFKVNKHSPKTKSCSKLNFNFIEFKEVFDKFRKKYNWTN
jgi:hypothetical protein